MAGMIMEFAKKKKPKVEVEVETEGGEGVGAAAKLFVDAMAAVRGDASDENGHALYEAMENLRAACESDVEDAESEELEDEEALGLGWRPTRRHHHKGKAAGGPRKLAAGR